jgi:hypothetical protein
MAKVKFLRNTSVAGRSFVAGDEIDLNDADTHAVVSIRRAEYVNENDDPKVTTEPAPNPSVIPDLQRSLDPKIRKVVAQGMETAIRQHEEEMRHPTVSDGIVRDEEGNPVFPEGDPGTPKSDNLTDDERRALADRERDPGNIHLDPTKGTTRAVESREPRVLTRDPQSASRPSTSISHGATKPAPAGSAEAAVKHQTTGPSGSHPRK